MGDTQPVMHKRAVVSSQPMSEARATPLTTPSIRARASTFRSRSRPCGKESNTRPTCQGSVGYRDRLLPMSLRRPRSRREPQLLRTPMAEARAKSRTTTIIGARATSWATTKPQGASQIVRDTQCISARRRGNENPYPERGPSSQRHPCWKRAMLRAEPKSEARAMLRAEPDPKARAEMEAKPVE